GERKQAVLAPAVAGLVFASALALWMLHSATMPKVVEEQYLSRLGQIQQLLPRLPAVLKQVAGLLAGGPRWDLLWWAALGAAAWLFIRREERSPEALFLVLVELGYLGGLIATYILSPWRNLEFQINHSFDRVVLPMLPPLLVLVSRALSPKGNVSPP